MSNYFISDINLGGSNAPFKLVKDMSTYNRVKAFWHPVYQKLYPNIARLDIDPGDQNALIFYRENIENGIKSMFRLALDCEQGLPEERFLTHLLSTRRKQGMQISELGRIVNNDSGFGLKGYFCCLYPLAKFLRIDTIVIVTNVKYKDFYTGTLGAELLCNDIGDNFGSVDIFGVFAWDLKNTKDRLFEWAGINSQVTQIGGEI